MDKDFQYIVGYKKYRWAPSGKWALLTYSKGKLSLVNKKGLEILGDGSDGLIIESSGHFGATRVGRYYVMASAGRLTEKTLRAFVDSILTFLKLHPQDQGMLRQLAFYRQLNSRMNWASFDMALGSGALGGVLLIKEGVAGIDISKMIQASLLGIKSRPTN